LPRAQLTQMSSLVGLGLLIFSICCATPRPARAPTSQTPLFSFGVIADIQYCDCASKRTRHYRSALPKLAEAITVLNAKKLAFVIHLGDFIDRDFASFAAPMTLYQQLEMPHYHVLGNHDFSVDPTQKQDVLQVFGLQKGYYEFSRDGWRFIVLDGNEISLYAWPKSSPQYAQAMSMFDQLHHQGTLHAKKYNGAVSDEQLTWLKGQLDDAARRGQRVVLFCHFPIFPPHELNLWNATQLKTLIESYEGVVAYMNGHNHKGNYGVDKGIHYVTFHGMVETPETNAFAAIDVYPDHLTIVGYGREPSRTLALPIPR